MKILKILCCINCSNKKKSKLRFKKKENVIYCIKCNEKYPVYRGIPVIVSKSGDFHHLRKALLPAKYRVSLKF